MGIWNHPCNEVCLIGKSLSIGCGKDFVTFITFIWLAFETFYMCYFLAIFEAFAPHKLLKCFVHFCFAPKAEARLQQNSQQRFYMLNDPFGLLQRRSAQCWSWLMAAVFETFSTVSDSALFNSPKRNPWKASYGCYLFQHPPTVASNGEKKCEAVCAATAVPCHADTPWKWKQILEKLRHSCPGWLASDSGPVLFCGKKRLGKAVSCRIHWMWKNKHMHQSFISLSYIQV